MLFPLIFSLKKIEFVKKNTKKLQNVTIEILLLNSLNRLYSGILSVSATMIKYYVKMLVSFSEQYFHMLSNNQ